LFRSGLRQYLALAQVLVLVLAQVSVRVPVRCHSPLRKSTAGLMNQSASTV
jgi:hypothetical protein